MIYNPWFEKKGIDAVVVPMGVKPEDYPAFFPHAVQADQHPRRAGHDAAQGHHVRAGRRADAHRARSPARATPCCCARTAACSATSSTAPASCAASSARASTLAGARALVVGNGGVGSPIAASLAAAGRRRDRPVRPERGRVRRRSRERLRAALPGDRGRDRLEGPRRLRPRRQRDAARHERRRPAADGRRAHRAEHLRRRGRDEAEITPFLAAAQASGCPIQVGTDMLFEQIPAYLEFFGFGTATARGAARRRTAADMTDRHKVVIVGGGLRRAQRGARVGARRRGRHGGGPHQPPPVPAAALPGGGGHPAARADRARAARRDQEAGERARGAGRGHRLRPRRRVVRAPRARTGGRSTLPYDTLVVAAGATHSYFGRDDFAGYAPGMKTVENARHLRDAILLAFEMAELATDPEERAEWLTFVVIGAGPTGVELVGRSPSSRTRCCRATTARSTRRRPRSCSWRGRARCSARSPEKLRAYTRTSWSRWASRCGSTRWPSTWTTRASPSRARTAWRRSAPARGSGRRGCRRRRWRSCSRRRPARSSTGRAASRCSPTARWPGIPRCSRSATWWR